jgi:hypothetical protein
VIVRCRECGAPRCPTSRVRLTSTSLQRRDAGGIRSGPGPRADQRRIARACRRGTVVDCYLAQDPGDGSERRSRQSPTVHLVALCLFIEHGIEGSDTFSCLARLLERRPNFRALGPRQIGIGSPSLRCELRRCGRPRAPRRNLGTRGLANLGARAAQNPEPRHQVAVTRLDVHHTVAGSTAERDRSWTLTPWDRAADVLFPVPFAGQPGMLAPPATSAACSGSAPTR